MSQVVNVGMSLITTVEDCYIQGEPAIKKLVPCTIEGCVVRISDMIAYIGKDRQDARKARIIDKDYKFSENNIGAENAPMINNMIVDIIENSYGKDYIQLSENAYNDLKSAKQENFNVIYKNENIDCQYNETIKPMFNELYFKLLLDLKKQDTQSWIYKHHIEFMNTQRRFYNGGDYTDEEDNQIVVDFIASMTDDYFIQLHKLLFPNSKYKICYHTYFE